MGSPLYDLLADSVLFDDHQIDVAYADLSESRLEEELSKYIVGAAKVAFTIQESLLQPAAGLLLATGTALKPRQMLVQGAFYVDRVVMDDPMFRVATSWQMGKIAAEELFKAEPPPVDRRALSWVSRYMKDLTPMVAANYVIFLPVNRAVGFASEAIPLPPPSDLVITPPPHIVDLLLSQIRMNAGTADIRRRDIGGTEGKPAIWVEFEGLEGATWFRTSSASPPSLTSPSREEVLRIVRSQEDWGLAGITIAAAARYAIHQAYRMIMGEYSVAKLVNASYATESPLAFDVLKAMEILGEPSTEVAAGRAVLDLKMPFLPNVNPGTLMDIRERESEAFRAFQQSLERALRILSQTSDPGERDRIVQDLTHDADAEVERVNRTVRRAHRSLAVDVALATLSAATAWQGSWREAAVPAVSSLIRAASRVRSQTHQGDWFFLWKVRRAARAHS
jgi:hypothetical protein